jgi:predicted N-acyltransferase
MEPLYRTEIYPSIQNINPNEWYTLIDVEKDIAMDQRLIRLMETTLNNQAGFWIVLFRDKQNKLAACACLSLFQTDIFQSAPGFLKKAVQLIRQYWTNAFKLKVLFCGLPTPSAHSHFRVREDVDIDIITSLLHETMVLIADQEKAALLVLKELDSSQHKQVNNLKKLGFVDGELEPLYQLRADFKDFEDYCNNLRSSYRYQVMANVKKFNRTELKVETFFDAAEIADHFTDSVYQLYVNVWEKAKEKLECMSIHFFRDIARMLPNQVVFTLITDQQTPVAFAIGLMSVDTYYNLYVGLDYSYNQKADVYFNLFYHELDVVFRLDKKKILLGQTSCSFKSRLGGVPDPRFFWVRPLNPFLHILFKGMKSFFFPKVKLISTNKVFK